VTSARLGRRGFLTLSAAALAAGCGVTRELTGGGEPGLIVRSAVPLPKPYQVPLPIPRTLKPVRSDATTD
jgi:spore coat protein A